MTPLAWRGVWVLAIWAGWIALLAPSIWAMGEAPTLSLRAAALACGVGSCLWGLLAIDGLQRPPGH